MSRRRRRRKAGRRPASTAQRASRAAPAPELPPIAGARWWHGVLASIVIALAAMASYSNALDGKLVYDDQAILINNPHIRSLGSIPHLFTLNWWAMTDVKGAAALYRPVSAASFAIDVALMGGHDPELAKLDRDSGGYSMRTMHATSTLYHALASVLVFLGLRELFERRLPVVLAAAGGLLFAVHPVHVEAVSSHVGRAEVLAGMFFFGALYAYLRGTRAGVSGRTAAMWVIAASVLWLAGLLSKEMAATLPLLLVGLDIFRARRRTIGRWLLYAAPFVVCGLLYVGLRAQALGTTDLATASYQALPSDRVSYGARLLTMTHAIAWEWRQLVAPLAPCPDGSGFPITTTMATGTWWLSLFVHMGVVALGVVAWRLGRRADRGVWLRPVVWGVVGLYVMILPVSNVIVNTGVVVSERALYIPSAAVVLVIVGLSGWAWTAWPAHFPRGIVIGLMTVVIGLGVVGTRARNPIWYDEENLFNAAIAHPFCGPQGFSGLARVLYGQRDYEGALAAANRSLKIRPNTVNLQRQAQCLQRLERHAEAARSYQVLVKNRVGGALNVQRLVQCHMASGNDAAALAVIDAHPQYSAMLSRLRADLEAKE